MNDLTLVTFSFNTPEVVELLLKSFVKHQGQGPHTIMLYENSTNTLTSDILDRNFVPYRRTPGDSHINSLNRMIGDCGTRYMLIVDSDIVIRRDIEPLFNKFKESGAALMGEECGNRYEYKLNPRIHPWFMFIDRQQIQENNIQFTDWNKIVATKSEGFYTVPPKQKVYDWPLYDVGATFLEDIRAKGLKVYDFKADPKYFYHYEGLSWHSLLDIPSAQKTHSDRMRDLQLDNAGLVGISLRCRFSHE